VRLLAVFVSLVLTACSTIPAYVPPATYAPKFSKAREGAKFAANQEKLVGLVEISAVRKAHPLGDGPYILCVRGDNSRNGVRTYAVFFKNNDYVSTRMSVMLDNCETQAFTSLGIGPFPAAKPAPDADQPPA
jgi:hypothetical protein